MSAAVVKGNRPARQLIVQLVNDVEEEARKSRQELFEQMTIYKQGAERELERCRALGIEPPEMIPHPDDIDINPRTGEVRLRGPFSPEEKANQDLLLEWRAEYQDDVSGYAGLYRKARSPGKRAMLLEDWHRAQARFDQINEVLPDRCKAELKDRSWEKDAPRPDSDMREWWRRRLTNGATARRAAAVPGDGSRAQGRRGIRD